MARLVVDFDTCSGHGRCYTVVPELLSCDDEGFVTIRGSEMEISDDQLTVARKAVGSCPEDAISLVE